MTPDQDALVREHVIRKPFKGNRDYVQGGDLVDTALSLFSDHDIEKAKFSVHRWMHSQKCCFDVRVSAPSDDELASAPCRGSLTLDGTRYWILVFEVEEADGAIDRVEFNEELVKEKCDISGQNVHMPGQSPFSLVETIISMKKHLLNTSYKEEGGRWIFTAVEFAKLPQQWDELEIRIEHNLQNKLVRSGIYADGMKTGSLYFSLVQE